MKLLMHAVLYGVFLSGLWVLGVTSRVVWEYSQDPVNGFFVFKGMTIPVGTIVGDGVATYPDGRVFKLDATDRKTGKLLPPWEIDWNRQSLPLQHHVKIQWGKILRYALLPPFAFVMLIFIVAAIWGEIVARRKNS